MDKRKLCLVIVILFLAAASSPEGVIIYEKKFPANEIIFENKSLKISRKEEVIHTFLKNYKLESCHDLEVIKDVSGEILLMRSEKQCIEIHRARSIKVNANAKKNNIIAYSVFFDSPEELCASELWVFSRIKMEKWKVTSELGDARLPIIDDEGKYLLFTGRNCGGKPPYLGPSIYIYSIKSHNFIKVLSSQVSGPSLGVNRWIDKDNIEVYDIPFESSKMNVYTVNIKKLKEILEKE